MKKPSFFLVCFLMFFLDAYVNAHTYVLKIDPLLSEYAYNQFYACLQELGKVAAPLSFVIQTFQETFPVLKNVYARVFDKNVTHIICKASHPLACSDSDSVVLASQVVVKKKFFKQEAYQDKMVIAYPQKTLVEKPYIQFVRAHADHKDIFADCSLAWKTPEEIFITYKNNKSILVADAYTCIEPKVMSAYHYVREDLIKKYKNEKKWLVDIRFKNQIIVYEGGRYEKSICT